MPLKRKKVLKDCGRRINRRKGRTVKNRGYLEQVEIVADDFLDFAEKTSEKYQLIIEIHHTLILKIWKTIQKKKQKKYARNFNYLIL